MRRKDGKKKKTARRTMPEFVHGFRSNPATVRYRHGSWSGLRTEEHATAVSLFAGCGGLDLAALGGFRFLGKTFPRRPIDILQAADNSEDAVAAYDLNLGSHAVLKDLATCAIDELSKADILMGGFPCQDFSSSGPKVGLSGSRGQLYRVLVEYMRVHRPAVVVGENVPHLGRLRGGEYLQTILDEFENTGYRFDVWELYGPEFGLPQSRRRLFLVGVRDDISGHPVKPTATNSRSVVPIDRALADLEEIEDESIPNQSQYFVASKASAGGGQGDHTNRRGEVAYCIRANARGRIQFHYSLPRRLTVRECARLQSFPDQFVFPFSTQRNLTLIGNAVPPMLGYCVMGSVHAFMAAKGLAPIGKLPAKALERAVSEHRHRNAQRELFAGNKE